MKAVVKNKRFEKNERYKVCVISSRTISRTNAGGRTRRFAFLVLMLDSVSGMVGLGKGKSDDRHGAFTKAKNDAQKQLCKIHLYKGTVPHNLETKYKNVKMIIKKANEGSGLIAGGVCRLICKHIGIRLSCKIQTRSKFEYLIARGFLEALKKFESIDTISQRLGLPVDEVLSRRM